MTRNIFVNDDTSTAFVAVDLVKNLGFGLWNMAKAAFYVGGIVSETYSGISQVILNDSKKSAEHFSEAKTDIIEVKILLWMYVKTFPI